jgi:pimeloyl-ACP methyl ester carboxylesterase
MRWAIPGLLATALLVGGCAAEQDPGLQPGPTEPTLPATDALRERCLSAMPDAAPVEALTLTDGSGRRIAAAEFAAATDDTVMVLLHQTGLGGLCGWGRFATRAAREGVTSLAIDMCGYGDSVCPADSANGDVDAADQVQPALDYARTVLGARRVVLVGASMGGSSTVIAVAHGARVDGWVDVSGPGAWGTDVLLDLAGRLPGPGLVVYARSDGVLEYAAAQQFARRADARFLDGGEGHGYELMTDFTGRLLPGGRAVIDFAQGTTD